MKIVGYRFTMTALFLTLLCAVFLRVNGLPHPPATTIPPALDKSLYNDKFDNINLDEILNQDRLLINYIKCLEGTGPCTPDGQMLKDSLPDAIKTDCSKCTEKQKFGVEKVTSHLIDNQPTAWKRLEKIYDPTGGYRIKYQEGKNKGSDIIT
ncbi:hypothetical protein KR018_008294 [Drosophila ironensis]|nr:hypothetical protein KR018_008294 [Drosophila ironensis]